MKRVRFNDVVEVRYFKKHKPIDNITLKKRSFYSTTSIIFLLLLILLLLVNLNQ